MNPLKTAANSKVSLEFYNRILGYIAKRINNKEDAKEITQEVFLKFSRHLSKLEADRITSWIVVTAKNSVVDFYRKKSKSPQFLYYSLDEFQVPDTTTPTDDNSIAFCLTPLLEELSIEEKNLLVAVDMEGKSQKKMAIEAEISYSSLKSRVQRSRTKLKKLLLECCSYPLDPKDIPISCDSKDKCC